MDEETRGTASTPDRSGGANIWLWIVGILALVIVGMYVWREVSVRGARGEAATAREEVTARAETAVEDRTERLLRLSALPLSWALREQVRARDYRRADEFLREFVQEEGVERVVVGVPGDSVALSTDRSLEGRRFSAAFPAELLQRTDPEVARLEDGSYRVAVPLFEATRTLGVVVVVYRPEPLRLGEEEEASPAPAADTAEPGGG